MCENCRARPIPKRNRKYCEICSPRASAFLKAALRKQARERWIAEGRKDPKPYLHHWPSKEAHREYFRKYMRERRERQRKRLTSNPHPARESARPTTTPDPGGQRHGT